MKFLAFILLPTLSFGQIVMNNQVECVAPSISVGPTSQTQVTNTSLTITVTASGTAPLAYQWTLGSSPVSGATTSSYATNSATAATNSYYVIVTNACGSITSSAAVLAWTNGASSWGSPTNNTDGVVAANWFRASDYYTNGSQPTLPDRANGFAMYLPSTTQAPVTNGLSPSGKTVLYFESANKYLRGALTCSNPPPYEVIMAVCVTNNFTNLMFFFCTHGSPYAGLYNSTASTIKYNGAPNPAFCPSITNKWFVLDFVCENNTGTLYTNNVLTTSSALTAPVAMYRMDMGYDAGSPIMLVGDLIVYTNTLPGTNTTYRYNVFNYLTNYYGIAP